MAVIPRFLFIWGSVLWLILMGFLACLMLPIDDDYALTLPNSLCTSSNVIDVHMHMRRGDHPVEAPKITCGIGRIRTLTDSAALIEARALFKSNYPSGAKSSINSQNYPSRKDAFKDDAGKGFLYSAFLSSFNRDCATPGAKESPIPGEATEPPTSSVMEHIVGLSKFPLCNEWMRSVTAKPDLKTAPAVNENCFVNHWMKSSRTSSIPVIQDSPHVYKRRPNVRVFV
ncbi:hypothetical protein B0J12DRAFT_698730 [Macrophomina phaseolina]|uniref:Uncharacterized protein n=1 Tax=Macrophomina phaseolina TaxID=35725 RepID=A0ABQ8GFC6_9PEZI|nr:hypothetical protein B0J12DRAFT_698730 [Macrophomina phaseolina]